jgi:hypothetical protein
MTIMTGLLLSLVHSIVSLRAVTIFNGLCKRKAANGARIIFVRVAKASFVG